MKKGTLKINGVYKNLAAISDFVNTWAKKTNLSERAAYAVQMAVDEACSNIIEHAYGGEGKGDIHITCTRLNEGLQIRIVDYGTPFDPTTVKTPDTTAPLEDRDVGGLGLFMMRQLMDEVHFQFGKTNNTLIMLKKQDPTP